MMLIALVTWQGACFPGQSHRCFHDESNVRALLQISAKSLEWTRSKRKKTCLFCTIMSRSLGNWMFHSNSSAELETPRRGSSARLLSIDSHDSSVTSPQSERMRSPLQFLKSHVRRWSRLSYDNSIESSPSANLETLAPLPDDCEETWTGEYPGISGMLCAFFD